MLENDVAPITLANQLLNSYEAGTSFFLSSPQRTILAVGESARMPTQGGADELANLPQCVHTFLNENKQFHNSRPVIVGAVPFDHLEPAHLILPKTICWGGPLSFDPKVQVERLIGATYEMNEVPELSEYEYGVREVLKRLERGDLRKVVLSRSLHLSSTIAVDVPQLLRNLARHNTHGYTFAVNLPKEKTYKSGLNCASSEAGQRTLVGASPELLVTRIGLKIKANPLAGSLPRSEDPIEDGRRAAALLRSVKDRHEHAVVVDAVAAALSSFCKRLMVPSSPSLVQTKTMWHLSSELTGELIDSSTSALALAVALHPTPAVCGAPTDLARAAIREIEPFDRGFFTGMVGWCDSNGDGEWVVAIRCAEVEDKSLRLFAGAGIVAGSSPEGELAETSAKLRTFLHAMGLNHQ